MYAMAPQSIYLHNQSMKLLGLYKLTIDLILVYTWVQVLHKDKINQLVRSQLHRHTFVQTHVPGFSLRSFSQLLSTITKYITVNISQLFY